MNVNRRNEFIKTTHRHWGLCIIYLLLCTKYSFHGVNGKPYYLCLCECLHRWHDRFKPGNNSVVIRHHRPWSWTSLAPPIKRNILATSSSVLLSLVDFWISAIFKKTVTLLLLLWDILLLFSLTLSITVVVKGLSHFKWAKLLKSKLPFLPQRNRRDSRALGTWRGSVQLMKKSIPWRTSAGVCDGEAIFSAPSKTH